jgi:N utilization substance protein B
VTEPPGGGTRPAASGSDARVAEREGRRLALGAIFEADFGLRTPGRVLERRIAEEGADAVAAAKAREIVDAVARERDTIDARIEARAPQYPVVQLARIDRALLRSAMGELLHCPATPTRVVIAEWVEMARTYSGEPTRRLLNGVLGQIAKEATSTAGAERARSVTSPEGRPTDPAHEEGTPP